MSENDAVVKRLNVLIRLMLDQQISENKCKRKDQLVLMDSLGFSTAEIAVIFGQDSKNTSSLLKRAKDDVKIRKKKSDENE